MSTQQYFPSSAAAPHLVDHLVLIDVAGVPTVRRVRDYSRPFLQAMRSVRVSLLPLLVTDALRAGPINLLRVAGELVRQDIRPLLASVNVPTLLVWGERDGIIPLSVGERLHRAIPRSRLVIIPRASHVRMYDDPRAVAEVILAFLQPPAGEGA